MVKRWVHPLKKRAHLLCDYTRVKDLIHEVIEELKADVVVEWVARLVSSKTIIAAENAIEAFSASYRPNLVSHLVHASFWFGAIVDYVGFVEIRLCSPCHRSAPASTSPIP